ncbi:hypothetical protein PPL_09825 [Heterostelium album PN500]|uniref:Uncharacterized protein n=1 Tax=Heterostelium pallidum (strain ATCC 26659 / Pp 5 / PN500) TaxID=670386 RepID=D3BP62_HETP5|nr:hypothetical protein PPL_09825 [Heterostelium album PN500]EFA77072.1 hypothetical protein PPL_09825 [Heterostelium album PN500]|eukprot:XP_020429201.1 hypothetical protein PPL_09825 [Heterostelium album PN500]
MSLRIVVTDCYFVDNKVIPQGTVESGVLKPGMLLLIQELNIKGTMLQFEMMQGGMNEAVVGDITAFSLTNISGNLTRDMVKPGFVITQA